MAVVAELFGYAPNDKSSNAAKSRKDARCPFMQAKCDGGGNRNMASVDLKKDHVLRGAFSKEVGDVAPCGICSIKAASSSSPWVICPRRILYLGGQPANQSGIFQCVFGLAGYESGSAVAVWPEVPLRARKNGQKFHYTFDYVIRKVGENGQFYGPPLIIEDMTCSTSGGNRAKGTDIQTAFKKTIMGQKAATPNVNVRQVWARMASQLIVKSEASIKWGGNTIWVVQDHLMDYIRGTTGLDANALKSDKLQEVNILSVGYGVAPKMGVRQMNQITLYAGPIAPSRSNRPCFMDIVRAPYCPPLSSLRKVLKGRSPAMLTIS